MESPISVPESQSSVIRLKDDVPSWCTLQVPPAYETILKVPCKVIIEVTRCQHADDNRESDFQFPTSVQHCDNDVSLLKIFSKLLPNL
jgi:hypothetical protein